MTELSVQVISFSDLSIGYYKLGADFCLYLSMQMVPIASKLGCIIAY